MKTSLLATIATLGLVATATAETPILTDGKYSVRADGATGTLTINGNKASIGIGSGSCAGSVEGPLTRQPDGSLSFFEAFGKTRCEIRLQATSDALASINPNGDCSAFHGASCDFAGVVTGPEVAYSFEAIDAGFERFSRAERRELQIRFGETGTYRGAPDGVSGPATRGAILDSANTALSEGQTVSLATPDEVQVFLELFLGRAPVTTVHVTAPSAVSAAPKLPTFASALPDGTSQTSPMEPVYFGRWTCTSSEVEVTSAVAIDGSTIQVDELDLAARYSGAEALDAQGQSFRFTLRRGDSAYIFNATPNHMFATFEGAVFECAR